LFAVSGDLPAAAAGLAAAGVLDAADPTLPLLFTGALRTPAAAVIAAVQSGVETGRDVVDGSEAAVHAVEDAVQFSVDGADGGVEADGGLDKLGGVAGVEIAGHVISPFVRSRTHITSNVCLCKCVKVDLC